jgi:hypothetical protein
MRRSIPFNLGGLSALFLFALLNLYSMETNWRGFDQFGAPGFPFAFMDNGYLFSNIRWSGLLGDLLFASIFCYLSGGLFHAVWGRSYASRSGRRS